MTRQARESYIAIPRNRTLSKECQEATKQGDLEKVRLLLESEPDIDAKDRYGQTALMNAAHAGQFELLRLLIEAGADVNIRSSKNFYGKTALILAE